MDLDAGKWGNKPVRTILGQVESPLAVTPRAHGRYQVAAGEVPAQPRHREEGRMGCRGNLGPM